MTKIHTVVDAEGRPVRFVPSPGQAHGGRATADLFFHLPGGATLLTDRAHDSDAICQWAKEYGMWANIPPRRNRKGSFPFSKWVYRPAQPGRALLQQAQAVPRHHYALRPAARELPRRNRARLRPHLAPKLIKSAPELTTHRIAYAHSFSTVKCHVVRAPMLLTECMYYFISDFSGYALPQK